MGGSLFRGGRARGNSTISAVIADVVVRGVVDHGFVVDIVKIRAANVIHRAVVVEASVIPISALITETAVAEAVVDASVKADIRTPVAFIPGECVAAPTPVTGRPEQASLRSRHPRACDPEVAFVAVRPVAGGPHVTIRWGHRLRVDR